MKPATDPITPHPSILLQQLATELNPRTQRRQIRQLRQLSTQIANVQTPWGLQVASA